MKACLSCGGNIAVNARFCPECGRDKTVPSPEHPDQARDTIRTQNVSVPSPPGNPGSSVLRGMGYSFGGCVFIFALGGCALIIAAGSGT